MGQQEAADGFLSAAGVGPLPTLEAGRCRAAFGMCARCDRLHCALRRCPSRTARIWLKTASDESHRSFFYGTAMTHGLLHLTTSSTGSYTCTHDCGLPDVHAGADPAKLDKPSQPVTHAESVCSTENYTRHHAQPTEHTVHREWSSVGGRVCGSHRGFSTSS